MNKLVLHSKDSFSYKRIKITTWVQRSVIHDKPQWGSRVSRKDAKVRKDAKPFGLQPANLT